MAEKNLNGLSLNAENLKHNAVQDDKLYQQFNGVHSSQSSRSSSPSMRLGQIPSSQLPPSRPIPQSQLPPSRSLIGSVTQQVGALNINQGVTGHSQQFGTTPQPSNTSKNLSTMSNVFMKDHINTNNLASISTQPTLNNPSLIGFQPQPEIVPKQDFPPSQSNAQPMENIKKTNYETPSVAQVKHIEPTPNINSQHIRLNPTQSNYWSPRTQPNQVQNTIGVPNSSTEPRISPITFQISPNRTVVNQTSHQSIQNNQATPNRTVQESSPILGQPNNPVGSYKHFSGPHLQQQSRPLFQPVISQMGQSGLPNQSSKPQLSHVGAPLTSNQQRMYQSSPFQQQDNQRYNSTKTVNSNASVNTNLLPSTSPLGSQASVYPQTSNSLPPLQPSNISQKANLHSNRYPTLPVNNYQQPSPGQYQYQEQTQKSIIPEQHSNTYLNQNNQHTSYQGVLNTGFNKQWGLEHLDLLQAPNILPNTKIEPPQIRLGQELLDQANCSPDVFRCTMTKIPENNSLLQKSRLPLGVLIHPFRDLNHLPVIQCNVIVRCRSCRTYINPFVIFVDNKRWKCNLCYRINELPEEFQYDPITKTYGDPTRRPEIKASTLEYIAPAEYMLRPPQPAVYLYLLDVSKLAVESGYLNIVSNILLDELKNLPGDARTQIGFIAYDSALHFYSLPEGITQPHEMTILDIDDVFLPTPDNLLVNLKDRMDLIADLLRLLPTRFSNSFDTNSALGAALQVAFKMMGPTGGRVTVFQAALPNVGPGALVSREDPSKRAAAEVAHLNPANDFYKRLALECSGQQIAVDMFIVNSQYVDIATISGISRFSGGCLHHFPLLKPSRPIISDSFARSFRRYITRKIGFEAVMRIRCTRGLSIHTFHGNFFVRSTDLLSLPNINPDAGFGMQVAIEESLADVQSVCFQAALLYTSSKGERRIRVHTMCLPIASTLQEIIHSADQQCIIGLLSKMAVDRSMQSSLLDAREAFINVAIDILTSYKMSLNLGSPVLGLLVPNCLRLLPLYISALLKHVAFRTSTSTRLDDRVMKMIDMKTKPLYMLIKDVYPDLFPIHNLEQQEVIMNSDEEPISMPPRLQLTARSLESRGAFLLDMGENMILFICPNVPQEFLNEVLGISHYNAIPDDMYEIPILDNIRNQRLHQFINYLNEDKPFAPPIQVIKDNSTNRSVFFERLIEDRVETALSYHEFLQHLKTQVK
ncbi:protein transport protein Sec24A [Diorhabda carinulata]|uniref:protein transport protein Sec24A n=1 Tax=Diorhabda carinulata TaxID=1163345 RepID=UPI0025A1C8A7|nr:protein transport protein Sec24A [Diorhabda carinulata]XP_057650880.1 protein transport protein Sec24A [Diorhabda carinulata]